MTAIALYFMYYNFGHIHQTLRVTPAMEAGVANHLWSIQKIVELMEELCLCSARRCLPGARPAVRTFSDFTRKRK